MRTSTGSDQLHYPASHLANSRLLTRASYWPRLGSRFLRAILQNELNPHTARRMQPHTVAPKYHFT